MTLSDFLAAVAISAAALVSALVYASRPLAPSDLVALTACERSELAGYPAETILQQRHLAVSRDRCGQRSLREGQRQILGGGV